MFEVSMTMFCKSSCHMCNCAYLMPLIIEISRRFAMGLPLDESRLLSVDSSYQKWFQSFILTISKNPTIIRNQQEVKFFY